MAVLITFPPLDLWFELWHLCLSQFRNRVFVLNRWTDATRGHRINLDTNIAHTNLTHAKRHQTKCAIKVNRSVYPNDAFKFSYFSRFSLTILRTFPDQPPRGHEGVWSAVLYVEKLEYTWRPAGQRPSTGSYCLLSVFSDISGRINSLLVGLDGP